MTIAIFWNGLFVGFDRLWESFQELFDCRFLVHADRGGIRAHERAAENAGGPMRDVVALELIEQRQLYLRLLRDRRESYLVFFTLLPQSSPETLWHTSEFASESTMTARSRRSKFDAFFRSAEPTAHHRLHVHDRRPIDRLDRSDAQAAAVDRADDDRMQSERIRPVGRPRREHAGQRIVQLGSRMDLQGPAMRLVEPRDDAPSAPCFGASFLSFSTDAITPIGRS